MFSFQWDRAILRSSFEKIPQSFSNYPSLKASEVYNCQNVKNTLKINRDKTCARVFTTRVRACIFDISVIMQLQSLQRWIITECLWNFFETRSQNGPISVQWKHQSEFIFCILRLSHKHITFDTLRWTPCSSVISWHWGNLLLIAWLVLYGQTKQFSIDMWYKLT